jgi:pilus assembly protein CpaF
MRRFGIPLDRISVVMNASRGTRDLTRAEIDEALGQRVLAEIPARRDRGWARAIDQLVRDLPDTPPASFPTLQPSMAGPVGDRRAGSRAAQPATPIPLFARTAVANDGIAISPERAGLKAELHETIMSRIDFHVAARAHSDVQKMAELRAQVDDIVGGLIAERGVVGSAEEAARLRREIVDEAVGLGPIEPLLRDDEITEIMVNGYRNVYIERRGLIERTPLRFANDLHVRLVIERIIAPLGRRIDEASPMVDARLPDGSRVNAIVEPLAIDGPALTIRRFGTRRLTMKDLIELGSLT